MCSAGPQRISTYRVPSVATSSTSSWVMRSIAGRVLHQRDRQVEGFEQLRLVGDLGGA